jgi:chemotaxis methyl-accepting protein methylase
MLTFEPEELALLHDWMHLALGLRGKDYRPSFLARRVGIRMRAKGCEDLAGYVRLLAGDRDEARTLSQKLMVPTTELFRNAEVFEALGPLFVERARRRGRVDVVSAPCSTGEEAVSFAILLEELRLPGRVLALDRSRRALAALAKGAFPAKALEKVDTRLQRRYFKKVGELVAVAERVMARVLPVCCDLGDGLPVRDAQVVAMRNFFIYLTDAAQGRILSDVERVVEPGGLLILGRAETLSPHHSTAWAALDRAARIYERRGGAR